MFERLTGALQRALKRLRGQGVLTPEDLRKGLREIRLALLEADVNYKVVRELLSRVEKRALSEEVQRSIAPGRKLEAVLFEELVRILGERREALRLEGKRPVVMLVGVEGSGKTTACAKLAVYLSKRGRRPALVGTDTRRPAAGEQLRQLAEKVGVPCITPEEGEEPWETARRAFKALPGCDCFLLDTAGRMHLEGDLLYELKRLKEEVKPLEMLLVLDAVTGQDAVNIAQRFNEEVGVTGFILTKMDSDARGGAAISIRWVTGRPIKFISSSERPEVPLEEFDPERMAKRIMGWGDVEGLMERAEQLVDEEVERRIEEKARKGRFDLEDLREQLRQLRRPGVLDQLKQLLPGWLRPQGPLEQLGLDERKIRRMEAIINSMTPQERRHPEILNASRKRRIARGSGTTVQEVNELLRYYRQVKAMMEQVAKWEGKFRGLSK